MLICYSVTCDKSLEAKLLLPQVINRHTFVESHPSLHIATLAIKEQDVAASNLKADVDAEASIHSSNRIWATLHPVVTSEMAQAKLAVVACLPHSRAKAVR